ncbi:MAG: hypothetical protein IT383_06340 [Deltaproteobacteria bacterium]|nr:hypothetical protein [Deltaproteobacteria bacterium]
MVAHSRGAPPIAPTPTSTPAASATPLDRYLAPPTAPPRPLDENDRRAARRAFDDLVGALDRAAGSANVRYALDSLVNAGGKAGRAARALLERGVVIAPPATCSVDDLARRIADAVATVADRSTAATAFTTLQGALSAFRAGVVKARLFALEPVLLPEALPVAPHVVPTRGFDPAVEGLRLDDEHSIGDLQSYVEQRFGAFVLADLVEHGRTIELHHGAREDAMASLLERGFDRIVRVRTPEGLLHNELYLAHNGATGEVRYAMTEIWGGTRLGHVQKLLRAAVVDGPHGPRRVEPRQVEVYAEPLRRPEEIYRRTSRALLASGTVPASVVVGFKAGILRELGRRAAQAKRLELVHDALGPDPVATLRARGAAAGAAGAPLVRCLEELGATAAVLREAPAELFRFAARIDDLQAVERALQAVVRAHPSVAPLVDDVLGAHGFKVVVSGMVADTIPEGSFIDQTVITYVDDEGARRNLLLTRNPYGEIAHELGRVLVDNGVENVFVFGTAGGLGAHDAVGDLHAPTAVIDHGVLPFANRAVAIATTIPERLRPPLRLGSRVANVASPVDETRREVDRLRGAGADLVEMELGHLVGALRGSSTTLSALYLVSDLPGTAKTIEQQGHHDLDAALHRAVDLLVEGLGMRGVLLRTDPKPPAPPPWRGAMVLAERALTRRGLRGEQHALLRYVIARYLLNGLSDRAIASLLADDKACPIQCAQLSPRWKEKALRELDAPATNDQIIAHLRSLNAELADAVREVRRLGGSADTMAIHILGSVVKGRAGCGSDVDTLIETKDQALAERVFDSPYGYRGAAPDHRVVIGGHDYVLARGQHYGPVVSLGDGSRVVDDPDALVRVWAEAAASFGITLTPDARGQWCVGVDDDALGRAAVTRETNPIAERLLEHEKQFRRSIETDFLLAHLKDLDPLADLTHLPLERLIHAGELLLRTRLVPSLTVDNLARVLDSPLGRDKLRGPAGEALLAATGLADADALIDRVRTTGLGELPLEMFIDGELAAALVGVGDRFSLLTLDLAAAERARRAYRGGATPRHFPFFARELRQARRHAGRAFANAAALRAGHR